MSDDVKSFTLYDGAVLMEFNPNSPRYRYTVTDEQNGVIKASTRGVTTVIGDILDKPGLRTWPMNMSHQALFGTKFDEKLLEYVHDWDKALLKPDTPFSEEELHNMMMDGSKEWTKRSDKGKDVGTMAHAACEAYLRGTEYVVPEDADPENVKMAMKSLGAFKGWWESLEDKELIEVEKPIYSRQLRYAGTFDLMARINGKVYMLDIKTTNAGREAPLGIYAEYFMQLGAYSYAMREETGIRADDCGIIRVGKDGKLCIATAVDLGLSTEDCERAFAFAIRLHDWLEQMKPFLQDARFVSHLSTAGKVGTADVSNKQEANNV